MVYSSQSGNAMHRYEFVLSLLTTLGEEVQRADSIEAVGELIVAGAMRLGFERARLWLLDADRQILRGLKSQGDHAFEGFAATLLSLDATPYTRDILLHRRLRVFTGEELGPWQLPHLLPASQFQPPLGQWIHAPIWTGQYCWGLLTLDNAQHYHVVSDVQRREVDLFCVIVAHALEESHLIEQHQQQQRQHKWHQQVIDITVRAQQAEGLEQLAEVIVDGGIELNFERARLWMLSDDSQFLIGTHQKGNFGLDNFIGFSMPCAQSPYVQRTLASCTPLRFHGLEHGPSYLAMQQKAHGYRPPRGDWVSLPLCSSSGEPIGMITLDNVSQPIPIDDQQMELLGSFARQVAVTLERARKSYRQDWIATLTNMQQATLETETPDAAARQIVEMSLKLGFQRARLWEYDESGNILLGVCQAGDQLPLDFVGQWMPLIASSYGRAEPDQREPLFLKGDAAEQIRLQFFLDEIGLQPPVGEWVCVPLWRNDSFLGILELDYGAQSHALYPGQRQLLHLLGRIIVTLYDYVRLSAAERLQRSRLAEQHQTVRILRKLDATAHRLQQAHDLKQVYQAIVEDALGFQRARLWMLEPGGKFLVCVSQHGCHRELTGFPIPLNESIYAKHVLSQREPQFFVDRANAPAFIDRHLEQLHFTQPVGQWICIPLLNSAGSPIGMLALDGWTEERSLITREICQLFAKHAEAALERARIRSEWQELHQIAYNLHQMPRQHTDHELLQEIAKVARKVFHADIVLVFPIHADSQILQEPVAAGDIWDLAEYPLRSPNLDDNIVRYLVREKTPYYSPHAAQDYRLAHLSTARRSFSQRQQTASFAGIPLLAQGQVIGVLCANYRIQRTFSADDRMLIELFAQMAGLVITTTRLTRNQERNRLARDLHDTVKTGLRALAGRLQTANALVRGMLLEPAYSAEASDQLHLIPRDQLSKVRADLHEANRISRVTFDDIKIILADLVVLDEQPLEQQLYARLRPTGLDGAVYLQISPAVPKLPPMLVRVLRNVLAEAAVNAFEHGHATAFRVAIRVVGTRLYVTASDNGSGFDRNAQHHLQSAHRGLANMRTRSLEIGGSLRVSTRPGHGTRLFFDLPLREGQTNCARLRHPICVRSYRKLRIVQSLEQ